LIPYSYFFLRNPSLWITIEHAVVFYVVASYLFWIARLVKTLRRPQLEFNRIIARYLLLGQVVGFIVPLVAAMAIFVGRISVPLNLAAPFVLLFSISLFVGVVLGRLRQSQMELVLSEKRAALGTLLASLAHELNNPMTFIYSALEPLRESLQSLKGKKGDRAWEDVDQLLGAIEEGATRSKAILENFRFFSYPGRQELQEADLHEILEQSLRLLTPKWKGRISIVRRFGKIPKVRCHPTEMGQVFVNLIANACDAIPKEGSIAISTEQSPSGVKIAIRDSGQGMTKESLSRIFDAFYTTKAQGEGTGLGLAITLEIVKKHGGTIDVKSEVGKGSEFMIILPLK
jgi:signal transduction histidine kinase